ncbi:MAG: hypothetical protein ACRBN8_30675 [Nannocystales bacterium]
MDHRQPDPTFAPTPPPRQRGQVWSRSALLLALGCPASGCLTEPYDRKIVDDVDTPILVGGFADNPDQTIDVEAWDYAAGAFTPIATPVSSTNVAATVWGTDFFNYSTTANLGPEHWDRLGNGHEAQLRASVPGYNFSTVRQDWISCLSDNLGSALDFAENCVAENLPRAFVYTQAYPTTVDALLETCPSAEEIAAIDAEITIELDPVVMADPAEAAMACTVGGSEASARLALYNALRAMKLLRFDEPMPLLGSNNLYEWVRDLGITLRISNQAISTGGGTGINLAWTPMTHPHKRAWVNPSSGTGLEGLVGLIVHESRHTTPGGGHGHACAGGNDVSYDAGGAWAAQHDFFLWLSEHSLGYLTQYQRDHAQAAAADIMGTRFCSP